MYEFAHGRKPRGVGYWAFFSNDKKGTTFWHFGSYTDAKKAAVEDAKKNGATVIKVGS